MLIVSPFCATDASSRRWRWRGDEFFQDVNSTLAAYMRAQLTACLIVGIVSTIGFTILGLPGPLVMGFLAGGLIHSLAARLLSLSWQHPRDCSTGMFFGSTGPGVPGCTACGAGLLCVSATDRAGNPSSPACCDHPILSGAEVAGMTGIFWQSRCGSLNGELSHWREHRGSEGLAEFLGANAVEPYPPDRATFPATTEEPLPTHPARNYTGRYGRARPTSQRGD